MIPSTIARLEKVRAFTPNVHAQWLAEENERAFLEWCRKPEEKQTISIVGIPSQFYEREKVRPWKWWSFLIP